MHSEDTYYGHLVLRLMGCFVLFYTSRVICKGRLTMEEIIFSLKHYWRFVDCEALELKALSQVALQLTVVSAAPLNEAFECM